MLLLILIFLIVQGVIHFFIKERSVKYSLKTDNNIYEIKENFEIFNDRSFYDFVVTNKKNETYIFSFEADLNKKKEIITDIKYYKEKDLKCIFPIYMKNNTSNIYCLYNGEQVSYDYLIQQKNKNISNIIKKLKKAGYNSKAWEVDSSAIVKTNDDRVEVYQKNIMSDYIFTIWNYKGLYILKRDEVLNKKILTNDQYESKCNALVGNYYFIHECPDDNIEEFLYYDIIENKKSNLKFKNEYEDSEFYFNGVYDNNLYFTDSNNKKQYSINPFSKKIKVVGNSIDGFISVEGNNIKSIEEKSFFKDNLYFNDRLMVTEVIDKYGKVDIKGDGNFYYFKTKNGELYRVHVEKKKKAELLFKFSDISDWKVKQGDIIVVSGDELYFYNTKVGLKLIAQNPELVYNYENICDFWRK